jgi:hypothetical protein
VLERGTKLRERLGGGILPWAFVGVDGRDALSAANLDLGNLGFELSCFLRRDGLSM